MSKSINKGISAPIGIFIIGLAALVAGVGVLKYQSSQMPNPETLPKLKILEAPKIIGGQKDEHGCLIAAGYSWCEAKSECLRVWEEECK